METKYEKKVVVSEDGYTIKMTFRGIYDRFIQMVAHEGDIKGEVTLITKNCRVKLGSIFSPVNLDFFRTSDYLCNQVINKNKKVDDILVAYLYAMALSKMKRET